MLRGIVANPSDVAQDAFATCVVGSLMRTYLQRSWYCLHLEGWPLLTESGLATLTIQIESTVEGAMQEHQLRSSLVPWHSSQDLSPVHVASPQLSATEALLELE